jgi:uncharacterized protein (TIGR01619 family)
MSDDWDFYFCRVDDKPASIMVDLGIAHEAPLPAYPYLGHIRIHMLRPRSDGLSSQEEYDDLVELEKDVCARICSEAEALYVGRNTSNGYRDLYFYAAEPDLFSSIANTAMKLFEDYKFEVGSRSDPQWTCYFEFLHPSDEDRQIIENRRVCAALESRGDRLGEIRKIDHFAYFTNESARALFVSRVEELGFQVCRAEAPRELGKRHLVEFSRKDRPADIDKVVLPLYSLAREVGGEYDGWGCMVVDQPLH